MTNPRDASSVEERARRDGTTVRLAALALPIGMLLLFVATGVHPHREDPMDNTAVFMEYADSGNWITIHFVQWIGAMLLFGGLFGVYYAIRSTSAAGGALARFGMAATLQAAAAITALQVVDGVALKWAVDAWVGAAPARETTAFAAAEALRWTEYGFQSYANILIGITLLLYGLAMAIGAGYPRWLGWLAMASGVAWTIHGAMVAYVGLFDSAPRLVGQLLLAVWVFVMAVLMWRTPHRPPTVENRITPLASTATP